MVVGNDTVFGVIQITLMARSYAWKFLPVAGDTFTDAGTAECHGPPGGAIARR